jgi:Flp pilus assembly protein CpaB
MTYRVRNIVIAVGLAALAAALTSLYVSGYKKNVQKDVSNVRVFVARVDIPAGTPGAKAANMLRPVEIARKNLVPGAISDRSQIDGITSDEIFAGEQVTTLRFRPVAQVGVRADLKGNQRAYQLAGDSNQLLVGTLKPGDRVDVVATVRYQIRQITGTNDDQIGDIERVASRVVLRDLRVLKVSGEAAAARVTNGAGFSTWVQLAVTDSQAQKLIFVTKSGSSTAEDWSLQLRPVVDATDSPESVETIESVLADGLKPRQILQLAGGGR